MVIRFADSAAAGGSGKLRKQDTESKIEKGRFLSR